MISHEHRTKGKRINVNEDIVTLKNISRISHDEMTIINILHAYFKIYFAAAICYI